MKPAYLILADFVGMKYRTDGLRPTRSTVESYFYEMQRVCNHPDFADPFYKDGIVTMAHKELSSRGGKSKRKKKIQVVALKVEVTNQMVEQGVLFSWMIKGGN